MMKLVGILQFAREYRLSPDAQQESDVQFVLLLSLDKSRKLSFDESRKRLQEMCEKILGIRSSRRAWQASSHQFPNVFLNA